jgi:hypothetical protein
LVSEVSRSALNVLQRAGGIMAKVNCACFL